MNSPHRLAGVLALLLSFSSTVDAAEPPPPAPKLKDEMRQPWQRDDVRYIRAWKVAGAFKCDLARDCLDIPGGEAAANPAETQKRADGSELAWREDRAWGDSLGFGAAAGERDGAVAYAATRIERATAGKATLAIGSSDGIRVWLNGKPLLARDGRRSLTPDEDRIEVDLAKGANTLLVKAGARSSIAARLLETGTVLARTVEIGPSIIEMQPEMFTVRTDVGTAHASAEPVRVEVVKPGGAIAFATSAKRGELVIVDAKGWPDGPYEVRARTLTPRRLSYVTHLPWFKGDSLAMARALAAAAAQANDAEPTGFTLKMLAEIVDDRLGVKLAEARGNPWPKIHSPLMEYAEILLERAGQADARARASGFMRIAYRDEVDGTAQFARAFLPADYDPAKKWPLVLQLHGYNPANPAYVRWWNVDSRHANIDTEFAGHEQIIFVEPHGRGNTRYFGLGDADVMRVLAQAKQLFNVDENRVYLTGESMGGWGTWNVATRHPDVFAAIAPVFGGVDYHSQMTEEQLGALTPLDRFIQERWSSWALAEGLNNTPIYIHHGDADEAVNVEWTRWGVRLLQRWGYDVRYHEYPGRLHETLRTGSSNPNMSVPWFLAQRRDPDPRRVRLRTPELRHAKSWWVDVLQSASSLAFVDVDAEIVERNVIRLDTQNVLDVRLTPGPALIDPLRPVNVVWNGVARELRLADGALRLTDPAYRPGKRIKNAQLPGGIVDFTTTPFAVVIGTSSRDPEVARLWRDKANDFISQWRNWQKHGPRVFEDTQLTDADLSRYSLLLFGGADANRVTAKLAGQLPVKLTKQAISIDGHAFAAPDSMIHLLYPNPRNDRRYVWLIAANSIDGLFGAQVRPEDLPEMDFVIQDGRMPAYGQLATRTQTAVASGMFDYNWRFSPALTTEGTAAVRAAANRLRRPTQMPGHRGEILDRYVGRYRVTNGPLVELRREGGRLFAKAGDDEGELLAQDESNYFMPAFGVWINFQRDAAGRVTGFTSAGGGDFEATRIE
jgi:dienelactone hydrolase